MRKLGRVNRAWCVVAASALLVVSTASAQADGADGVVPTSTNLEAPASISLAEPVPVSLDEFVATFTHDTGVTTEDATLVYQTNKAIADFAIANEDNPSFGAVWVEYNPFTVRLRLATDVDDTLSTEFSQSLGRDVAVSHGGASAAALHGAAQILSQTSITFSVNEQTGQIDITGPDQALIEEQIFRAATLVDGGLLSGGRVDESAQSQRTVAAAGDAVGFLYPGQGSYTNVCTAGAMYEGTGVSGFITAGHCPDGNTYVNGFYSAAPTLRAESCNPDYQLQDFQYAPSPYNSAHAAPTYYVMYLAGGTYATQPVLKIGITSGNVSGQVVTYENHYFAAGGDCAASTNYTLKTSTTAAPGDSGGPILVLYNGYYYLRGITTGGASDTWSAYTPQFSLSGVHICEYANLC
jgi:hypothetical protein